MDKNLEMTIGDLEKRSGIRRSTIHHYIWYGLLHQPYKTGKTMAYYDQSHLKRLEMIQQIKMDYLKSAKTSRVPLDFIKHRMTDGYTLTKDKAAEDTRPRRISGGPGKKKKTEIIEATLKLYADRGYYLTNIRDIAKAVGISAPTFYHYFQDKRELFVEVIEYVIQNLGEEFNAAIEQEKDIAKRTTLMFRIFYKHYTKIGEIINQLRAGVAIGDEWARERLAKLYGEMTTNVAREVSLGIKNGLIRDVDPELNGFFTILLNEIAVHRASLDNKYTVEQVMQFVGDMLYHAFLTEKGKKVFGSLDRSRA
ncbi:MAG: TetR family transcriptional regulator [Deltaproteobacteria bacterium]|nr:TetR family transcriptional regulator [Deltaproteobacteria bacterium]